MSTVIMQQASTFSEYCEDITASKGLGKEACNTLKNYNHMQVL